jgi:hypothetical protein
VSVCTLVVVCKYVRVCECSVGTDSYYRLWSKLEGGVFDQVPHSLWTTYISIEVFILLGEQAHTHTHIVIWLRDVKASIARNSPVVDCSHVCMGKVRHSQTHTCLLTHTRTHTNARIYTRAYTHIHTHTQTRARTRIYTRAHTHTCTHTTLLFAQGLPADPSRDLERLAPKFIECIEESHAKVRAAYLSPFQDCLMTLTQAPRMNF